MDLFKNNQDIRDEKISTLINPAEVSDEREQEQETFQQNDDDKHAPKVDKSRFYILLSLLFIVLAICALSLNSEFKDTLSANITGVKAMLSKQPKEDASPEEMGDYFYDQVADNSVGSSPVTSGEKEKFVVYDGANSKSSNPDEVVIKPTNNTDVKVITTNDVLINNIDNSYDAGRVNPFVPFVDPVVHQPGKQKDLYDVILPPQIIATDTKAQELMKTYISGIMYDPKSPSAIINLEGVDQLVKKGDYIRGYRVLNITRDKVVIKQGSDVYKVAIGEPLNQGELYKNDVSNLNRRFAGSVSNNIQIKVKK